jgi:DNA mismatch endonuclease (patch repair protein)
MSRIKNKDTKPELLVRSIIHKSGFRFRKNRTDLPGRPDIVLPRFRKIIFVHGCFWHGHKNCKRASLPSTNRKFWEDKINKNKARDRSNYKQLKKLGWSFLVLWQCDLKKRNEDEIRKRIIEFLNDS